MANTVLPTPVRPPGLDPNWTKFVQEGRRGDVHVWRSTTSPLHGDFFPSLNPQNSEPRQYHVYDSKDQMIQQELVKEMQAAAERGLNLEGEEENCFNGVKSGAQYRCNIQQEIEINGRKFKCTYQMDKNNPLNGQRYLEKQGDGQVVEQVVEGGISPSLNRAAPGMTLARRCTMVNAKGKEETVCYAGRPDTRDKFKELASMVFLGELDPERNTGNGITYNPDTDSYELNFAMNSFISTFSLMGPEAALVEKEYEELQDFNGDTICITDKNGKEHYVKVNIRFFSRQFNFMNGLEKELPKGISGERRSRQMSDSTAELEALIPEDKLKTRDIQRLLSILKENDRRHHLKSEEEIFTRIYLCQLANIPLVMHCRSCVDRTSIGVAIAYALKQWRALGNRLPYNPYEILDREDFKELWLANIPPGLLMTMYSRTASGFKWQPGPLPYITQHPAVLRLMPKRYITEFYLGNPKLNIASKSPTHWISAADFKGQGWTRVAAVILRCIATLLLIGTVFITIDKEHLKGKKALAALFLWLPICIMRSPLKTITHWIMAPDLKGQGLKRLAVGFLRLLATLFLVGTGLATIGLILGFGTLYGIVISILGILKEMGVIDKDSKWGTLGDIKGFLLGIKLVKSLFVDMPSSHILKDGIQLNGEHNLLFNGKGQD